MHLEEGGIVLEDNFKNCKVVYLVRRDGMNQKSVDNLFSLLIEGSIYKLHPLSQTWTYNVSGVHGPALHIHLDYDLLFLGTSQIVDSIFVDSKAEFARFLHNSQVLWIPLDELNRCDIYEYE